MDAFSAQQEIPRENHVPIVNCVSTATATATAAVQNILLNCVHKNRFRSYLNQSNWRHNAKQFKRHQNYFSHHKCDTHSHMQQQTLLTFRILCSEFNLSFCLLFSLVDMVSVFFSFFCIFCPKVKTSEEMLTGNSGFESERETEKKKAPFK